MLRGFIITGLPLIAGFFSMVEVKVMHEHWLHSELLGAVEVPLRSILDLVGVIVEDRDASAVAASTPRAHTHTKHTNTTLAQMMHRELLYIVSVRGRVMHPRAPSFRC